MGADPLAWRYRLAEGMTQLVGARVAHVGDAIGFPARQLTEAGMIQVGLEEPGQTALFEEWFQFLMNGGGSEESFLREFAAFPVDRPITLSIGQLLNRE